MINPELSKFVQDQRATGASDDQIKQALLAKGWGEADINMALTGQTVPGSRSLGQLVSVKDTIKQAWEIFTNNASQYLAIMLVLALITGVWSWYAASQQEAIQDGGRGLVAIYPIMLVVVIVMAVIGVLTQIMLLYMTLHREQKLSTAALLDMAKPKFWGSLWISILTGVMVMIGFFLLLVPGIYLAVATMFASLIYLDQNITGYDAISKSREYVKGYWGDVFARLFVAAIIYILATVIVSIPFSSNPVAANVVTSILGLVLTPMGTIYMVLIYEQLKSIKSA